MEISLLLVKKIAEMFLIIFASCLLVKKGILQARSSRGLSEVTLMLVMPCVILNAFQVEFTSEKFHGFLLALLAAVIIHIFNLGATWLLKKPLCLDEVEQASIIYSNGGNLIIPIVSSVLGSEWVLYTSAFVMFQTILLWTHCKMLLCGEKGISLRKILTNINVIAIAAGVLLFLLGITFPPVIGNAVSSVGNMIGPVSMIVTGMLIGSMDFKKILSYRRLPLITILRMLVYPTVLLLLFKFSPMRTLVPDGKTILLISFLAAAAPAASTITQMSQLYGRDAEYASVISVVTTLCCIITIPLLVMFY